jgi:hypothetical protein
MLIPYAGYIYCCSNKLMPGMLKIGMTWRTPVIHLKETSQLDTWKPPNKYQLEFAKHVKYPYKKEKLIHKILERHYKRINTDREFFQTSVDEVKDIFELIDGTWWENNVPPILNANKNINAADATCNELVCKQAADFIPIQIETLTKNGITIYHFQGQKSYTKLSS